MGLVLTKMTPFSAPTHRVIQPDRNRHRKLAGILFYTQGFYSTHSQALQWWEQIYVFAFELLKSDNTSTQTQLYLGNRNFKSRQT